MHGFIKFNIIKDLLSYCNAHLQNELKTDQQKQQKRLYQVVKDNV